jgi:drug/metabolite transporter (DMT)-like permease
MTKAFHTSSASTIVPFQYLGAIYAFVIGFYVFDETLNAIIYLSLTAIFIGVVGNAYLRTKIKTIQ